MGVVLLSWLLGSASCGALAGWGRAARLPRRRVARIGVGPSWCVCLHGEVSSGAPIVGGASFLIRVRAEPTRNTKNAAQPSRKSSHPHSRNRTYVHDGPRPRRELWVCELFRIVRDRRSSGTAFQLAAASRPRAIWWSRNEAARLFDARERTAHVGAIGGRPLASESAGIGTAETTRSPEEERSSVETQGEKYGSRR